jgi:hypothetical protein
MSDLCIAEFNARVARIERAHAKGYGFEAVGTLGRSSYTQYQRRKIRKLRVMQPLLVVLICGTLMKALILHHLGLQVYELHVARLMQNGVFDQIGGFVMHADPVTVSLAQGMARIVAP